MDNTPPPVAVRAGDMMQVGEDMRLLIEIADAAISIAEHYGCAPAEVARLRAVLDQFGRAR